MCLSSIYCPATVPWSTGVRRLLNFIPLYIDIPESTSHAISRHLFSLYCLSFSPWMLVEFMSWRAVLVCIMSSCTHSLQPRPRREFLIALHLLSLQLLITKSELTIRAEPYGTTPSYPFCILILFSLHVGGSLQRPKMAVCNTCWTKLRYRRWYCLGGFIASTTLGLQHI